MQLHLFASSVHLKAKRQNYAQEHAICAIRSLRITTTRFAASLKAAARVSKVFTMDLVVQKRVCKPVWLDERRKVNRVHHVEAQITPDARGKVPHVESPLEYRTAPVSQAERPNKSPDQLV